MNYANLKAVSEFIKSELVTISTLAGVQVNIFGQSGYDFTCSEFNGYIHPSDYFEIVGNMNFMSN